MPSLENLTHAELKAFLADLLALQAAGQAAIEKGRRPSYCIAPGYDMGLTIAAIVPEACDAHADLFREGPAAIAPLCAAPFTGHPGPYPESGPPSPPPEQTLADAPPVADEGAAGGAADAFTFAAGADPDHPDIVFQPADVLQTEAREKPLPDGQSPAEEGGGEAGSSPATVSASHEKTMAGTNWTDEEEERLVRLITDAVGLGASKTAAIRAAAQALGRPEAGTAFRCHHKLKARIDAAIAEVDEIPAGQPAPEAAPAAMEGEDPGEQERVDAQDPPQGAAVAGAVPIQQGPIDRHIDDLPRLTHGRRWTEAEDADLLRCLVNGMKLPEISADLQLDAGKIKARIAELTRRFDAATMLAALEARLPQAAE